MRAAESADRTFLVFDEDGREIDFAELDRATSRVAALLRQEGIPKGGVVGLLLANVPEFVLAYLGAMRMGAVANPINCHLTSHEIHQILEHSGARILFTSSEFYGRVAAIRDRLPDLETVVLVDPSGSLPKRTLDFRRALAEASPEPDAPEDVRGDDPAMIIYTSGTTGQPKGVVLTNRNLLADARDLTLWFGFDSSTRMGCVLPLFHVNGEVVTTITPLFFGGSVVLFRKFQTTRFWHALSERRIRVVSIVPTVLYMLLHHSRLDGRPDASAVKFFICGAAPLPVELHSQFEETFGIPIIEGYGLSETTCYSSMNPIDGSRKIGSIGRPIGNEMRVVDEEGLDCPPGVLGEIVIRGENVMCGYHRMPEVTAEVIRGGWLHSGDLGMRDAEGYFYCLDRKKDVINRAGSKIYPREIDEVLHRHPLVKDAATIGVPNEIYGEEVKSYVVLKSGALATRGDLLDHCREYLAHFKCPKTIHFVDEIPKGPTGKPLKRVLREIG